MPDFSLFDLLPGVYVAGLGVLAAAALRRWFDPLPWRVLAVFLLVLAVYFAAPLVAGKILLPLDALRGFAPFQDLPPSSPRGFAQQADQLVEFPSYMVRTRRCLGALRWPLLNPLVGAGEPLLTNTQAQHFHPLTVLALPFYLGAAVGVVSALKVLVALISSFLLFRRFGVGEGPALAASLAYGTSGYMLLYLGWPLANSGAFLPLLIYALTLAIDRGARPDLLLVAIACVGLWLGGNPETILDASLIGFAFALRGLAGQPWRRARRALLRVGATTTLTAAVLAPILLPTVLYLPQSFRFQLLERVDQVRARQAPAAARSDAVRGMIRRGLPAVAPNAFGNARYGRYWGDSTIFRDASGFVGTATALAVLLALLPVGKRRRLPAEWLVLGLGLLSYVIIVQPPGLRELMRSLPLLGHSASGHRRLTLVVALCGAWAAAYTWERWRRYGLRRGFVLLAAGGLGAVITWAYLAHPCPDGPRIQWDVRLGFLLAHLAALAMAAGLLVSFPRGRPPRWAPWLLAAVVAGELVYVHRDMNPAMPRELYFPSRPSIEYLQQHLGRDRIVGLDFTFRHNVPVIYGIADLRSASPLQPARLAALTARLRPSIVRYKFSIPDDPLYDLLGVRYVLVEPERRLPPPLRLVFRGNAWIYERPHPLPRLFLPATAEAGPEPSLGRWEWVDGVVTIADFARRAVVSPGAGRESWQASSDHRPALAIVDDDGARIRARAHLPERRLLASGILQDGGWRLLVDGRRTKTFFTNGAFVGAWLEAGEHRLDLVYRPPGFVAGCLLAALALTTALVWWPRRTAS